MSRSPSKRKPAGTKVRAGLAVSARNLPESLGKVNLNAAGIDIGATAHYVAVPQGRDENNVRCFQTFTAELHALAYLVEGMLLPQKFLQFTMRLVTLAL